MRCSRTTNRQFSSVSRRSAFEARQFKARGFGFAGSSLRFSVVGPDFKFGVHNAVSLSLLF